MTNKKHYPLIILGSGPAGCTAAIYASRANIDCALISGMEPGGQLMKSSEIANWPGEPDVISGPALMEKMMNQVRGFNQNIISDHISQVNLSCSPFYLKGDMGEYTCDALIIGTGSSAKFLGLESEKRYAGKGVSSCAVCDGFFYKNKDVAVVGGGSTAVEDALYLSKIAKTVTLIHRRDVLTAEELEIDNLKREENVKFEFNHVVEEIVGDEGGVTGVKIKSTVSESIKDLQVDGVFIAVGHQPNTKVFTGQLDMDHGYIISGFGCPSGTSVPGVFVAGDVKAKSYRQAVVAAGAGCIAAFDAKSYLDSLKNK